MDDGAKAIDSQDAECAGLDEARGEALRRLRQMLQDEQEAFWRDRYWKMSVADEHGLTLFCIELSATLAPVMRGLG